MGDFHLLQSQQTKVLFGFASTEQVLELSKSEAEGILLLLLRWVSQEAMMSEAQKYSSAHTG